VTIADGLHHLVDQSMRTCSCQATASPNPDVAVFETGASLKPHVDRVQPVIEVAQATRRRDPGSKLVDYLRDTVEWALFGKFGVAVERNCLMFHALFRRFR
jgi:hypothetical protein